MWMAVLTASAYFYFNWMYFGLSRALKEDPCLRGWPILFSFFINYGFFTLCSILEYPLIANWSVFAFLLFLETFLFNKRDWRNALFATLMGIIYGLAVNIFCRSIMAILIKQPLQAFDNHITSIGNMKGVPIFWGFLLAGIVLQVFSRPVICKRMSLILKYPQHQSFLLEIMGGLFLYLFLNLLLYSTPHNDLLLKIWSIKSCMFCVIGFYIAIRYTRRICELSGYREENQRIQQELEKKRQEEEQLRQQAIHDMLTGLYNRQYAEERIASLMEQEVQFALCFLDLDGLKTVNDRYGHDTGDRYIRIVVEQLCHACRDKEDLLFRYGGDEFLVVCQGMAVKTAEERMEAINEKLLTLRKKDSLYPSVSESQKASFMTVGKN